jgi:hypothetical protein
MRSEQESARVTNHPDRRNSEKLAMNDFKPIEEIRLAWLD